MFFLFLSFQIIFNHFTTQYILFEKSRFKVLLVIQAYWFLFIRVYKNAVVTQKMVLTKFYNPEK